MVELEQVVIRRNEKLVRELGPLVTACLNDSRTEDVLLNADSTLWVKRTHSDFEVVGKMTSAQALSAFGTIAAIRNTVINHETRFWKRSCPLMGAASRG